MESSPTQTLQITRPKDVEGATIVVRKVPILGQSPSSSILDDPESFSGTLPYSDLLDTQPQDTIGAYRIVREVGAGGMGVVYEAVDQRLKRRVAIKMIRGGVRMTRDAVRRFQTEAEAVAQTQHPNIVQIHEVGWHDGQPFVALEYLPGGSLYAKAANKPQSPLEAATLVRILAEAMHHAHTQGVIHRDLKPANILFAADGTPKVTDFGAARLTQEGPDSNTPGAALTQIGEVIGTPQYMAPEQARGTPGAITAKIDVYALGAVLYHLLTGRPPHDGPDAFDVVNAVVQNDPVSPRRLVPKVPRDLEVICLKALEKHPSNRYESAKDMAEDLGRFLAGDSILAKPDPSIIRLWRKARRKPVIAGLVAGIVIVALAGFSGVLWQWRLAVKETHRATLAEKSIEGALTETQTAGIAATKSAEVARTETAKAQEESRLKDISLYRSRVSEIAMMLENGDFEQARLKLEESAVIEAGRPDPRHWEWYYLNRLGTNQLWRHNNDIVRGFDFWTHSIAVSPGGKHVAFSCGDPYRDHGFDLFVPASLVITEAVTGRRVAAWRDYLPESAQQLVWRDATTIVAATPHKGFRVMKFPEGTVLNEWGVIEGVRRGETISRSHISPDGKFVYRCSSLNEVSLYDTYRGEVVRRFKFDAPITTLSTMTQTSMPHWRIVVATQKDCRVIDPQTGLDVLVLPIQFSSYGAIDPAGRRLALYHDGPKNQKTTLEVWNLETGKKEWSIPRPKLTEYSRLAFSPDGDKLAEMFNQGVCLRVHDAATGTLDFELRGHTNRILSFQFSPDGRQIATASNDASVRIWNLKDVVEVARLRGHSTGARAVAFDPNGWRLYTGGMDQNTYAWDLTRERIDGTRLPFAGAMDDSWGGAFSGGLWCASDGLGRFLDTSAGKMLVFDPATYTPVKIVKMTCLERRGEKSSTDFALSADGRFLFGPANIGKPDPCLWDASTGAVLHRFCPTIVGKLTAAALSPDGAFAAASIIESKTPTDPIRHFHIWDCATGVELHHTVLEGYSYSALTFDTDNRLYCGIASNNSIENGLHVIDLKTKSVTKMEYNRPTFIKHITLSADNRWIATIDHRMDEQGQKLDLRDLSGDHPGWARRNIGPATGLAFSPDGKRLACVRFDDSLTLYDVESNFEAFYKKVPCNRFGDYAFPARVAFSPDGRSLMMNHSSGQLSVWRTELNSVQETLRSQQRRQEATDSAYAFHLRAARELCAKPDSVGFRFHKEWLDKLTPPNEFLKNEWQDLK